MPGRGAGLRPARRGAGARRRAGNRASTAKPACSSRAEVDGAGGGARRVARPRLRRRSASRRHAEQFSRERHLEQMRARHRRDDARARRDPMVRRYNRLLVAFYVVTDALLAMWAFILAYGIRFESGLIPVTRGYPPIEHYINVLPFVALLTPLAFQLQGVYRLRRGRSRVDDFFAVLIGSILAVVFGVSSTLYVQAYYVSEEAKAAGAYEVSQLVWALFLVLTVALHLRVARGRARAARAALARRHRAQADPHRRRRRPRPHGRRPHPAAPRARLPGDRLRRRPRRRRSHRLSRPAAARHARRRSPTSRSASASTISTSRCRSTSTPSCST